MVSTFSVVVAGTVGCLVEAAVDVAGTSVVVAGALVVVAGRSVVVS